MTPGHAYLTDDMRQLLRSSGSIGANYLEANQALGNKDRLMRMRIARKEAREAEFWLQMIIPFVPGSQQADWNALRQEVMEICKILSAIIQKLITP